MFTAFGVGSSFKITVTTCEPHLKISKHSKKIKYESVIAFNTVITEIIYKCLNNLKTRNIMLLN